MIYRLHTWLADHISWVQYPQLRRVRQAPAPRRRISYTLLISSVYLIALGMFMLAALLYIAHLFI